MRRKKRIVLLTSYILAGFIALGGLAYSYHLKAEEYKLQLENDYQRAFNEFVIGVSELNLASKEPEDVAVAAGFHVHGGIREAQWRNALGELLFSSDEFRTPPDSSQGWATTPICSQKKQAGKTISEEGRITS